MAFLVFFTPAHASACGDTAPARPIIHISTAETPVAFNLKKSVAQLNHMDIDTKSPFPSSYHTDVGGVMSGEIAVTHKMKFNTLVTDGKQCATLREVDVEISISPTVFIASDFQDQPCWFKQIFAHETKHVEVDRAIMKKYAGQMTDGLNLALMDPADYTTGWVDTTAIGDMKDNMQAGIDQAIEVMFNKMMADRRKRQQQVDSRDEYERISAACKPNS